MSVGANPPFGTSVFRLVAVPCNPQNPETLTPATHRNYPGVKQTNEKVIRDAFRIHDRYSLFTGERLLAQDKRLGATPGSLKDFFAYTNSERTTVDMYFGKESILNSWLKWRFPKWSEGRRAKLIDEVMGSSTSYTTGPQNAFPLYSTGRTLNDSIRVWLQSYLLPDNPSAPTATQIRVSALDEELTGKSFDQLIALFTNWLNLENVEKIADAIQWAVGTENEPVAKALVAFMATKPNVPDDLLAAKLPTELYSAAHSWPKMAFEILIHHLINQAKQDGDGYLSRHIHPTNIGIITKLNLLAGEAAILDGKYYGVRVDTPR